MFFPSCSASYLPLDTDQSIKFYKNENLSFPPLPPPPPPATVTCIRNAPTMFPTENDSIQASHDFRPVAHLSSNGYYGYIPLANNAMPKDISTEVTTVNSGAMHPHTSAVEGQSDVCSSVLLDCQRQPATSAAVDDSAMMMDSASEMENYHQQPQQQQQQNHRLSQHLRKRKEYSEELEHSCKRRKTWMEENQQHQHTGMTDFHHQQNWNQSQTDEMMECHDQAMEEPSTCIGIETPVMMNGKSIGFNHLQPPFQPVANPLPQPALVQQPKNQLEALRSVRIQWNVAIPGSLGSDSSARKKHTAAAASALFKPELAERHNHGGSQELETLFISLHGSGFFWAGS